MANRTLKIQHIIHGQLGSSKDSYVNTFYVFGDNDLEASNGSGQTKGEELADFIFGFYDTQETSPGAGVSISEYYSARCQGDRDVKIYDMAAPPHSAPILTQSRVQMSHIPDRRPLPEEVSLCLSYKALSFGTSPGRRRGRIYLGPFNDAAVDEIMNNNEPVRPAGALREAMLNAAYHLAGRLTSRGWSWRMWSQTSNLGFDIVEVSVDDAFDTIRGRGTAPSGRYTLALA